MTPLPKNVLTLLVEWILCYSVCCKFKNTHAHTHVRTHTHSLWMTVYLLQLLNEREGEAENFGPAPMLLSVCLCQHNRDSPHLCSEILWRPWKIATWRFLERRGGTFELACFLHFPVTRADFKPAVWWCFDPGRAAWIMDQLIFQSVRYVVMENTRAHTQTHASKFEKRKPTGPHFPVQKV